MGALHDKIKAQAEKAQKERMALIESIKDGFAQVADTPAGVRVLKEIYRRSGYGLPNRAINATFQSLDVNGMILNEGRRSLWQEIRAFIPKKMLAEIEE